MKTILSFFRGLFLLIVSVLAFTTFGCFRKKTPAKKTVETELESLFPGQFKVLDTNLKMLDIMAQFKGEKLALIEDAADPEVQFLLDWQKGAEAIGFDSATVMTAHTDAKKDVAQARTLFKTLKDNGLENFSVGVIHPAAYIQVFAEPTPALRTKTLEILKSAPRPPQTSIFIELLEPAEFHKAYQDIIPQGHWKTGAGIQGEQRILTLNFEYNASMDISELNRHWEINTSATRHNQLHDQALQSAQAWAEKNLTKPFFIPGDGYTSIESMVSEEPSVRMGFPYYDKEPTEAEKLSGDKEPKGYVVGTYYFDQKVFGKLRKQAEF
jgi:hypothetical protein